MSIKDLEKILPQLSFGTCSWKYDSWQGIIYPHEKVENHLNYYAEHYNSVEIDQWFWSLFGVDTIKLPDVSTVYKYVSSVPKDFTFTIKVPNSITLTHFYRKKKSDPLVVNPHFLSPDLFMQFYDSLEPMHSQIGTFIFQFEYLNKEKMPSLYHFLYLFEEFLRHVPEGLPIAIEIRNPNFLVPQYFDFLKEKGLAHVFLQGYFMPNVADLLPKFKSRLSNFTVIRLHGPDRIDIEKISGGKWNKILLPKDDELTKIVHEIFDLINRHLKIYINVNNHYEGSAPLTIRRLEKIIRGQFANSNQLS